MLLDQNYQLMDEKVKRFNALLDEKDKLIKEKDKRLEENYQRDILFNTLLEEKDKRIVSLSREVLRERGQLSSRGIVERILQLIHEEREQRGRFNATATASALDRRADAEGAPISFDHCFHAF